MKSEPLLGRMGERDSGPKHRGLWGREGGSMAWELSSLIQLITLIRFSLLIFKLTGDVLINFVRAPPTVGTALFGIPRVNGE